VVAAKRMPEETQANREVVDLVREVMGMGPLYRQRTTPPHAWLSSITEAYTESLPTRTAPKGSNR
jgi:hypothetical protein